MPLRAFTCLLLWALCATAQAQTTSPATPRSITVSGHGTAIAVPDRARVQLSVQKSHKVMAEARTEVLAVVERFLALTRKLGIDPKRVRSTAVMVHPEYRWEQPTGRQILTGYRVVRELEVEVIDLDTLGTLIEDAVSAGITNVSPPTLYSSRLRDIHREALTAAATDAEQNARVLAGTLGAKLGPVRELVAGDATPPSPPMPMVRMKATAMAESMDAGATYEPGSLEFEAQVNATFDLIVP